MKSQQPSAEPHLLRLDEMKRHRVSKNESDIRGWDVVTADRRNIGKVHDLVVDVASMTVRYLDVAVEAKVLGTKAASHVLIPIGGATLDDDDERVYLDEVSVERLTSLPPFDHRPITRDFERSITGAFARRSSENQPTPAPSPVATETPVENTSTDQERFWGARRRGRDTPYLTPIEDPTDSDRTK